MNDVHHYEKKLKWELNRLKEASFSRQDRVIIAKYAEFLEARGLNKGRIAKAVHQPRTLRIELHLLMTGLSRTLREVVGRSFKCYGAEVTMVNRTGLEGTRETPASPQTVNWVIEESPAPTLWHKSKFKPPSRALQIVAVFRDEISVKHYCYRSAPP